MFHKIFKSRYILYDGKYYTKKKIRKKLKIRFMDIDSMPKDFLISVIDKEIRCQDIIIFSRRLLIINILFTNDTEIVKYLFNKLIEYYLPIPYSYCENHGRHEQSYVESNKNVWNFLLKIHHNAFIKHREFFKTTVDQTCLSLMASYHPELVYFYRDCFEFEKLIGICEKVPVSKQKSLCIDIQREIVRRRIINGNIFNP